MDITFNGGASQSTKTDKSKGVLEKAEDIIAVYREEMSLNCSEGQIPSETIMLALFDDPDVQEFLDSIRGLKKEILKDVIGQYCKDALVKGTALRPQQVDKEDLFVTRLSCSSQWDLEHFEGDDCTPVHLFASLLSDQLRPTNPHYAYNNAGISSENLMRAQRSWSLERNFSKIPDPLENNFD